MRRRHNKLEMAYSAYLTSLSEGQTPLDRKRFLELLVTDDDFRKIFGKDTTRPLTFDERLKIAYPDTVERIQTLVFLGTITMKRHLNNMKIPDRRIRRKPKEINEFIKRNIK
jgi:hypothetical protein